MNLDALAELWRRAQTTVVFTGAGISTESGIPDFRSPGGRWERHRPIMFDEFVASREAREAYWRRSLEMWPMVRDAEPNEGHVALARAEASGQLTAVITQNIDDLHQRAGSRRVLELHGTSARVKCLECGESWLRAPIQRRVEQGEAAPDCHICGGPLKPATISFGQAMPTDVMTDAVTLTQSTDLFFVVGSSLAVHPAASLPALAVRAGADLIIINRDPTPCDELATAVVREPAGETLRRLVERLAPTSFL